MSQRPIEQITGDACASSAGPHAADLPVDISHAEMDAAYRTGRAVSLGRAIPWLARYRDAWWVVYEGGWLRVDDKSAEADLDRLAARLTRAEAIATRDAAIRRAYRPSELGECREDGPWTG